MKLNLSKDLNWVVLPLSISWQRLQSNIPMSRDPFAMLVRVICDRCDPRHVWHYVDSYDTDCSIELDGFHCSWCTRSRNKLKMQTCRMIDNFYSHKSSKLEPWDELCLWMRHSDALDELRSHIQCNSRVEVDFHSSVGCWYYGHYRLS